MLLIKSFLTQPFEGSSLPLAHGIIDVDLSNIIAGCLTDVGLSVLQSICGSFADSENLVDVNLSDNAIGDITVCQHVLNKKSLERLALSNVGLTNESMRWVQNALSGDGKYLNLTKIDFFKNASGDTG